MEKRNNNTPEQGGNEMGQRELDRNETLQDAGAAVPDYGRAGQELDELEKEHGRGNRQGNSSIQEDREDTLGNP